MSEPTLVLEYELTCDRAKAELRHLLKVRRRSWWQGVAAGSFLFVVLFSLADGDYLWAAILGIIGLEMWFSIVSRLMERGYIRSLSLKPRRIRFELDDRGLVRGPQLPKQSPLRYWWKSLRRVSEDEDAIDLDFGGQILSVPQHAFADEEQRSTFRSLVAAHLFDRNRLARECAKLDRNEEQQLAEEAFASDAFS